MIDNTPRTIGFNWSGAGVLLGIYMIPLFAIAVAAIAKEPRSVGAWQLAIGGTVLVGSLAAYLASFKITILADRLVYHRFPGRKRTVPYADIQRAEVQVGLSISSSNVGLATLVLRRRSSDAPVLIDLKPFSPRGLAAVAQAIKANAPDVEMDECVKGLLKGDVRPVAVETVRFLKTPRFVWFVLRVLFILLFALLLKAWLQR